MQSLKIKYRSWNKGIPPRPIKLDIPGWAGEPNKHTDGDKPQPWHCPPFVEGATYGMELLYPFETECRIHIKDGKTQFDGDFDEEEKECGIKLPPFSTFAPHHFGFTSSLDIESDPDYVIRIAPHPRFYTDHTGEVPCAITAHLQSWWPRIFFVVFKSPLPGQTLVFRHKEPYAQLLVLPKRVAYEVEEMSGEDKFVRSLRDQRIAKYGKHVSKNSWKDHKGNRFDDKYKMLSTEFNKNGVEGVDNMLEAACDFAEEEKAKAEKKMRGRMKRKLLKPHESI